MDSTILHIVQPENTRDTYSEYDQLQFGLDFEGRQILLNSVRFEAELRVYTDATPTDIDNNHDVQFDPKVGAHSLISSVVTEFQNQGLIENTTEW